MRDNLYFLDPHTWVSQLPGESKELLYSCGENKVESVLTNFGPAAWLKALCDKNFLLPAGITNQDQLKQKIASPLTDQDIFKLAVFYTRVQMCLYLRENTALFHTRISGRTQYKDLQNAGLTAAHLIINGWEKWMVPFDKHGKFVLEWWNDASF